MKCCSAVSRKRSRYFSRYLPGGAGPAPVSPAAAPSEVRGIVGLTSSPHVLPGILPPQAPELQNYSAPESSEANKKSLPLFAIPDPTGSVSLPLNAALPDRLGPLSPKAGMLCWSLGGLAC